MGILDILILFVFPLSIILISKGFILLKVIFLARMRRNTLQDCRWQSTASQVGQRQKRLKTVSRRVIILSTTYLICNAPLCNFNVILMKENNISMEIENLYKTMYHIFMFLSNNDNFMLYCLIRSGFKKVFIKPFKRGSRFWTSKESEC